MRLLVSLGIFGGPHDNSLLMGESRIPKATLTASDEVTSNSRTPEEMDAATHSEDAALQNEVAPRSRIASSIHTAHLGSGLMLSIELSLEKFAKLLARSPSKSARVAGEVAVAALLGGEFIKKFVNSPRFNFVVQPKVAPFVSKIAPPIPVVGHENPVTHQYYRSGDVMQTINSATGEPEPIKITDQAGQERVRVIIGYSAHAEATFERNAVTRDSFGNPIACKWPTDGAEESKPVERETSATEDDGVSASTAPEERKWLTNALWTAEILPDMRYTLLDGNLVSIVTADLTEEEYAIFKHGGAAQLGFIVGPDRRGYPAGHPEYKKEDQSLISRQSIVIHGKTHEKYNVTARYPQHMTTLNRPDIKGALERALVNACAQLTTIKPTNKQTYHLVIQERVQALAKSPKITIESDTQSTLSAVERAEFNRIVAEFNNECETILYQASKKVGILTSIEYFNKSATNAPDFAAHSVMAHYAQQRVNTGSETSDAYRQEARKKIAWLERTGKISSKTATTARVDVESGKKVVQLQKKGPSSTTKKEEKKNIALAHRQEQTVQRSAEHKPKQLMRGPR